MVPPTDIELNPEGSKTDLVIITGMSGAGRTEAMHIFEDLDYYCIDNLPLTLLMSLVASEDIPGQPGNSRKLAVVCDARNRGYFFELTNELAKLREAGIPYRIMFLDANDQALLARYKASRRRHPMCSDNKMTIAQGIAQERALLSELREIANFVLDTSHLKPVEMRQVIQRDFAGREAQTGLGVVVYSFGFKHGAALDADIVIDVRFLPNPYYDPEMRSLTGLDDVVRDFVLSQRQTKEFVSHWEALLACIMPGYVTEGKQQLAIAVGCTGGQHRSVALAETTGQFLRSIGYRVHVSHRDLSLADTRGHDREPDEGDDGVVKDAMLPADGGSGEGER